MVRMRVQDVLSLLLLLLVSHAAWATPTVRANVQRVIPSKMGLDYFESVHFERFDGASEEQWDTAFRAFVAELGRDFGTFERLDLSSIEFHHSTAGELQVSGRAPCFEQGYLDTLEVDWTIRHEGSDQTRKFSRRTTFMCGLGLGDFGRGLFREVVPGTRVDQLQFVSSGSFRDVSKAFRAADPGDLDEIFDALREIGTLEGETSELLFNLGALYDLAGQTEPAIYYYQRAIALKESRIYRHALEVAQTRRVEQKWLLDHGWKVRPATVGGMLATVLPYSGLPSAKRVDLVTSPPGAKILFRGEVVAYSPASLLAVPDGAASTLRVEAPGYVPVDLAVDEPGPVVFKSVTLDPILVRVTLTGLPAGAEVLLDGQRVIAGRDGRATLAAVRVGSRSVMVGHADYQRLETSIVVQEDRANIIALVPVPRPATVRFRSTPAGTLHWTTPNDSGETELPDRVSIPPGKLRYRIVERGYDTYEGVIEVRPGRSYWLDVTLVRAGELERARAQRQNGIASSALPSTTLAIAADPARPERLYLVDTNHKLWWSRDGGTAWTEAVAAGVVPQLTAVFPGPRDELLGLAADGIYRTFDHGESWSKLPGSVEQGDDGLGAVLAIARDPVNGSVFHVLANSKVLATTDAGEHFEVLEAPAPVLGIAVDPGGGGRIFAVVEGQGLMSHTAVDGWRPALAGLRSLTGLQIVHTTGASDEVLLGTADGMVHRSIDGGATFALVADPLPLGESERLIALAQDPVDLALLAVTSGGRIYRRAGATAWVAAGTSTEVAALAQDGVTWMSLGDNALRIGTQRGVEQLDMTALLEPARQRGGETRVFVPASVVPGMQGLAVDPLAPSRLLGLGGEGEMWLSVDSGRHFTALPKLPAGTARWLACDGARVLAASESDVWVLEGTAWQVVDRRPGAVRGLVSSGRSVWVMTEGSIAELGGADADVVPLTSTPSFVTLSGAPWVVDERGNVDRWTGTAWERVALPSGARGDPILGLVADPTTREDALLLTGRGLWRWRPADRTWIAATPVVDGAPVMPLALAVDPSDHSLYLASTDGRLFRSASAGEVWRQLDDGLPTELVALRVAGGSVYALGRGGDLLASSRVLVRERVSSQVFFETGSSDLSPEGHTALAELVQRLGGPGARLRIEGHTDDLGSVSLNQELSLARATSVAGALEALGFPASSILTEGFGPDRPIDDNRTEEGRSRNRRVEILVLE